MNRSSGGSPRIEIQGDKANGHVEDFAGNFMSMDEGAPVSVDGYKAKRTGRAAEIAPVG